MSDDGTIIEMPGRGCRCVSDGVVADTSACPIHTLETSPVAQAVMQRYEEHRQASAEMAIQRFESALKAIRGPCDEGPWIDAYRAAGGGYEGLQAIAKAALWEDEADA